MVQPPGGPSVPNDLLNIVLIERVVMAVEKISRTVDKISGATDDIQDKSEVAEKSAANVDKALKQIHERLALGTEELEKQEKHWKEIDEVVKNFQASLKGALSAFSTGNVEGMVSSIANIVPGGAGLMGFLFMGAKQGAEYDAAAHKALAGLRGLGYDGSKYVGQVTGEIRRMDDAWGTMGAELSATMDQFAKMSVGPEQFQRASQSAKGFTADIRGTATAIDLLNHVQAGETAKLIGTTMQQSALSIQEASDQVFNLAANLRSLHLDYGMFGQGIIQANSALRLQNQSLGDTTRLFTDLRKGLGDQGMTKTQAGAMALSGIQAGMQAIGGLNEGVQGKIAQQLAMRGVKGFAGLTDPAALITQFQFGMSGGKAGEFGSDVFSELKSFAMQAAGARPGESEHERQNRQIFALEKIGGMPPEAARAIIISGKASLDQIDPVKATSKHIEGLDTAFKAYRQQFSGFEAIMRAMKNLIGDLARATIDMIFPALRLIVNEVQQLRLALKIGPLSKEEKEYQRALVEEETQLNKDALAGQTRFGEKLHTILTKAGADIGDVGMTKEARDKRAQVDAARTNAYGMDQTSLELGGGGTAKERAMIEDRVRRHVAAIDRGDEDDPTDNPFAEGNQSTRADLVRLVAEDVIQGMRENGLLHDDVDHVVINVVTRRGTKEPSGAKAGS